LRRPHLAKHLNSVVWPEVLPSGLLSSVVHAPHCAHLPARRRAWRLTQTVVPAVEPSGRRIKGSLISLLASMPMAGNVYVGSAAADAPVNRGWLLGHFMPSGDVRHSSEVEIKWGVHPLGDQRAAWVTGETRTALIV